jgi:hypothetical protein
MVKKATKAPKAPIIAEASMSAGSGGHLGGGLTGKAIEDAMSQATLDALGKGIVDPDRILKLKLAARDKLVSDHAKAAKAAAKAAKG